MALKPAQDAASRPAQYLFKTCDHMLFVSGVLALSAARFISTSSGFRLHSIAIQMPDSSVKFRLPL